ncbi:protein spinster homolog 3 isoform X1 [Ictalurus punctatus]|uniref:Protein spinster homolog 3 isoform X1 n=3 Tax=Ictalurus punctatus TaxID=7998 RepID=A0A2D0QD50_ICTPU|nr:protein spinster homolog 3 isoform X1 [Ictalurus punctatus]XP_053533155.1 protein spinster homolog 3 isoform X1 [Ictalurus punctatus]
MNNSIPQSRRVNTVKLFFNMEEETHESSFGPQEKISLSSSMNANRCYGSIASEPEENQTFTTNVNDSKLSRRRSYVAVAVLCYVNLLNYMDRYTIAGVLSSLQKYFGISDSTSGLLQTVFICSFMLLAPVFGYLGDRYNRKLIMVGGMIAWIVTTLGSSFVTAEYFWVLVLMRALVGTGEASYCTIAPTIIGDLFTGSQRTLMIAFFYIFIPVGSGLGYILGATIATATGDWRWALRLNPILALPGLILLVFLTPNPPRGASETDGEACIEHTSYLEDIKYLLRNRSFVWSTLGVTAMAFVTGALAFWTPTFMSRARVIQGITAPCSEEPCDPSDSFVFGGITVVTGIVGVFIGSLISRQLRDKVANADPLICAVGMLSSAPCLYIAMVLASISIPATYTFIGIGEILLSLNWAILADILLYVVIPTRRATAEALQILTCHLLGDAGSPYLIGIVSDALSKLKPDSADWRFRSLEYSVILCPFIGVLGGLFFLLTALYIKEDRKAAEMLTKGETPDQAEPVTEST